MSESENRLGACEVCGFSKAKYTCPKCEVKTCSLKCINIHKKELECDGFRDKTKFVPLQKFTNLDLLNDYRLLEDAHRTVENLKKDKLKYYTRINKDLPRHLYLLKKELSNRKTTIHFLPGNFTRHRENTTYLDFKSTIVYWRIEWVFVHAEYLKLVSEKCDENLKLSHVIDQYLDPDKYVNDNLKYYHSIGLNGISFYLKAENHTGNKFYLLESHLSLQECFKNKIIIECPTIYVIFKDHRHIFETIDSDEELNNDCSNPVKYVSELLKAEEDSISKNSLLFNNEGELSSDEN